MQPINPKVTAAAAGGAIGGGAVATLLIWIMQSVFGMAEAEFTPDRVVALTSICGGLVGFTAGWLKRHGMSTD